MTSTVARLACAAGMEDPGRVADDAGRRPDPEVPERARRRTFTAKYKLEVLADYDAAPEGEKGAVLRREGLYSSHIVQWRKARDAGALAGWPPRAAASGVMRRPSRSPGCKARSSDWSRSWPRPAPWWMSRQTSRALGDSPGARIPSRGRGDDRPGRHRADTAAGPTRRLRGDRGVAGRLLPAPPAKPGTATARAHRASRIGSVISRGR